ncbi:MAG: PP2C family protein-serine/threonine phosphatase [Spirochaetales bacterium]|nr:PP2C family protein-serine/threonine phosphatase [Spirochaetales bacterium]
MELMNHIDDSLNISPVFLIGKKKRKQILLQEALKPEFLKCEIIPWGKIIIEKEGIYVIYSPPVTSAEKKILKKLIESNTFIIILFKAAINNNDYRKNLLLLPSVSNINIIKDILLLALSMKKQELKLQRFREELQNRNEEWINELNLANKLQKSLLPRDILHDLPINFAHKYLPQAYIGGDFYDIIKFNKNKIGIIIADVSGHGAAAAFITAMLKSALNHCSQEEASPACLLSRLNEEFYNNIRDHYITAFYAIIDIAAMRCIYCNAGHPKQLLLHKDGKIDELKTSGFFIGMFRNIILEERIISLTPGDRIVFYTDGLTDARNQKDEKFGLKRLKTYLKDENQSDIIQLSNFILTKVILHMKENRFPDDITLLIAEIIEDI